MAYFVTHTHTHTPTHPPTHTHVHTHTHTHPHTHTHTYTHSDAIAPRSKGGGASVLPVLDGDTDKLEEAVIKGEGRATLRLKKDGQAVVEEVVSDTKSS